ncbi:MAG: hypothetical protein AAFR39_08150 [Pseudomonadota bacterium]
MRLLLVVGLAAGIVANPTSACENPITSVEEVYPTASVLPENLLRFYIYFSSPMGRADILPAINLLDAEGSVVDGVFLSNRFDLWSSDRTRLTLLLDPGRVKTGLRANLEMGRALIVGETYHLEISQAAEDGQGCPLVAARRVTFKVTDADLSSPSPDDWELIAPAAGTRQPLTLLLDNAMDHLSLAYRLRAVGPDGAPVPGRIALREAETLWEFTPIAPWPAVAHRVVIDPMLEDLAGNRPGALFDQPVSTPATPWSSSLTWTPKVP